MFCFSAVWLPGGSSVVPWQCVCVFFFFLQHPLWIPSELNPWPLSCPQAWVLALRCRPPSWVQLTCELCFTSEARLPTPLRNFTGEKKKRADRKFPFSTTHAWQAKPSDTSFLTPCLKEPAAGFWLFTFRKCWTETKSKLPASLIKSGSRRSTYVYSH